MHVPHETICPPRVINPSLTEHDMPCLSKLVDQDQLAFEETN